MSKSKIETAFNGVSVHGGDVWVADYTELSKDHPEHLHKGVCIQDVPFDDISSFHLSNPNGVVFYAVNFEHNKGFFPEAVNDCECMFRVKSVNKGWVLLCELKYCKEKNLTDNVDKAYSQLKSTWQLIVDKGIVDARRVKTYFNISVPEHANRAPFDAFMNSQDEKLEWLKKYKIHLLGYNDVVVVNKGILRVENPQI